MNKIVKFLKLSAIAVIIIILIKIIVSIIYPGPTKWEIYNIYTKDKNVLESVKNGLLTLEFETIHISKSDGLGPIENKNTIENVLYLIEDRGYDRIYKDKNFINFQIWSIKDRARGVVFTVDGKKPQLDYPMKLEIIQNRWYYYEEDFNEWKLQNE